MTAIPRRVGGSAMTEDDKALVARLEPTQDDGGICPFCRRDPYHYVDVGVGMVHAAVNCCDLGIALHQYGDEHLIAEVALRKEAADAITRLSADLDKLSVIARAGYELTGRWMKRHADTSDEVDALREENERLRAALIRLRDCDWVISLPDRMDAVRDIARAALSQTQVRKGEETA